MLAPLFGYFFCMITMLAAAVVVLTGISNISMIGNGRQHLRPPVIGRTVMVELQRHSPVAKSPAAKEEAPAKDASPVVATANANTKKASTTNPKYWPVTLTTTAIGTRWVMPKNLGTARVVSFSADPALRLPADRRSEGQPWRNALYQGKRGSD
jgi:hypothetical protein